MAPLRAFREIGSVGVDSGQIWVGDPCYIDDAFPHTPAGQENWMRFTSPRFPDETTVHPYAYSNDGMLCGTTHGDGSYPVYGIQDEHGRLRAVLIDFDDVMERF